LTALSFSSFFRGRDEEKGGSPSSAGVRFSLFSPSYITSEYKRKNLLECPGEGGLLFFGAGRGEKERLLTA